MRQRAMIAMALTNNPDAADRRRAHHRARRHHPGPDPGADAGDLQRDFGIGHPADHARPRRGRQAGRPRAGDVRAAGWSRRAPCDEIFYRPAAPLHLGAAGLGAAAGPSAAPSSRPITGQPPIAAEHRPGTAARSPTAAAGRRRLLRASRLHRAPCIEPLASVDAETRTASPRASHAGDADGAGRRERATAQTRRLRGAHAGRRRALLAVERPEEALLRSVAGSCRQQGIGDVRAVDGVSPSPCATARRSAWWASPAAASRPRRARDPAPARAHRGGVMLRRPDITALRGNELKDARRNMQMIFQDPVRVAQPAHAGERRSSPSRWWRMNHRHDGKDPAPRCAKLLDGGRPATAITATRYPHEFSGGQRQRIGVARALALGPS